MAHSSYEIEEMILNKITLALRNEFSNTEIIAIYKDQTKQSFTKPCIVVLEYDSQEDHMLNHCARYSVWFDVSIHIEVDSTTVNGIFTLMRKYAARISRILDYITLEAEYTNNRTMKLKKRDWRSFIQDGVGHCMFSYDFIATTRDEETITPVTSVTGENYKK